MPPQKLSKKRLGTLGAAAAIATLLINEGIQMWNSGDQLDGAFFMCAGGALFIIDYFFLS
jgi:hypothetical protein